MTVSLLYQAVARSRTVEKTFYPARKIIYFTEVSRVPPHQIVPS